jgi:hypothetical protein
MGIGLPLKRLLIRRAKTKPICGTLDKRQKALM